MKRHLISWYLLSFFGMVFTLSSCGQTSNSTNNTNQIPCDDTLWNHVYNAYRLKVIEKCKTVRGTIVKEINEPDGDVHIMLRLDSGQEYLLNAMNYKKERGCLVIEPICEHIILQPDAARPCRGYANKVYIPKIGEHVEATETYVTDTKHGWNEIHPITEITIIK